LYGVLEKECEVAEVIETNNSDKEKEWSDKDLTELLEPVESKESTDANACQQSASAIKKVCYYE
jgi:hypothetical protein